MGGHPWLHCSTCALVHDREDQTGGHPWPHSSKGAPQAIAGILRAGPCNGRTHAHRPDPRRPRPARRGPVGGVRPWRLPDHRHPGAIRLGQAHRHARQGLPAVAGHRRHRGGCIAGHRRFLQEGLSTAAATMGAMDVSHLIDTLNDAQREAVCAPPGHYLVLAGAGSGKTSVLTRRIGWLTQVERVPPWAILAVTFTNKAAGEMRARLESLIPGGTQGLTVGTFHGIAHRLLRRHWREAGLPEGFQILDADDQQRLVKRVVAGLGLDEARFPPRQATWTINGWKDEGKRPDAIEHRDHPVTHTLVRIYQAYEDACRRAGLVDFAELLLRAHELWLKNPAVLEHYQNRWRHLLIDEFQDTNTLQYAWIRVLAGSTSKVFAVGDDDQSIYGWRGAKVENMAQFLRDFPGARTIKLEQNYRSTSTILKAANSVIQRNGSRLGKELWTAGDDGERIALYAAYNEQDEARFVIERIREYIDEHGSARDCAILYRSNAQSRNFEEQLVQRNIGYRVYGGQRFFERAEVKDALAYLRLTANRHDDAAFERAVNTPPRGIGDRTLDTLRRRARGENTSMWEAALIELSGGSELAGRAKNAVKAFLALIDEMARAFGGTGNGERGTEE